MKVELEMEFFGRLVKADKFQLNIIGTFAGITKEGIKKGISLFGGEYFPAYVIAKKCLYIGHKYSPSIFLNFLGKPEFFLQWDKDHHEQVAQTG
jgi:hypothetical protein